MGLVIAVIGINVQQGQPCLHSLAMLCNATCTLCLLFVHDSQVFLNRHVFLFFVASST